MHPRCLNKYSSSLPCNIFSSQMGRMPYLALNSDPLIDEILNSDFNELKIAATRLIHHAAKLGGKGLGTSFFKWLASFAAIYLLILDRTNWRTNMLTSLLVPYIFFSLPEGIFDLVRGCWEMDCLRCSGIEALLPTTFPRLARDSRVVDSASGGSTRVLCTLIERPLGWRRDMFDHWMLPSARAHSRIRWLQKLSYSKPWHFQHPWHRPPPCLPCLGHACSLLLALNPTHLLLTSSSTKNFVTSFTFFCFFSSYPLYIFSK